MRVPCSKRILMCCLFFTLFLAFSQKNACSDESDSSACISCHTDLEEMDEYGAKAASAAAAVAG